jgi:hypothetical protein
MFMLIDSATTKNICLWRISMFMLIVGWVYLYLSNQVLIKFDQLKILNAVNLSSFLVKLCIYIFPTLC